MDIHGYWNVTLSQNAKKMKDYFCEDAYINCHNTNERFNVDEFIRANCEYPGNWDGEIKRIEQIDDLIITVVRVFSMDEDLSLHVVSFIKIKDEKIISIDEYWGDDGVVPKWRIEKCIGSIIE